MLYCTGVFRILSCINHCLVHIVCSVLSICIGFIMFVSHFASCIVALHAVSVVLVDACLLYHTIVCSERRYCVIQGLPSHAVSSSVLLEVVRAASSACVLLEGTCVPTQTPAGHLNFSATRGAHTCRTQNFELQCIF